MALLLWALVSRCLLTDLLASACLHVMALVGDFLVSGDWTCCGASPLCRMNTVGFVVFGPSVPTSNTPHPQLSRRPLVNFVATVLGVVVGFRLPVYSGTSSFRFRRRHSCGLRSVYSMVALSYCVPSRNSVYSLLGLPALLRCVHFDMICTLFCVFSPCRRQCTFCVRGLAS